MLCQNLQRAIAFARRKAFYWVQRNTGWGIDKQLEGRLNEQTNKFVTQDDAGPAVPIETHSSDSFNFSDTIRFSLVRDDIYRRFVTQQDGTESDEFDRKGHWVPRGCRIFFDHTDDVYIKVFDEHYCAKGEGRFLPIALDNGVYEFLCPALAYLIKDNNGQLRGYAIYAGRILTPYEFERYVGVGLKAAIFEITKRSGLYFNDLTFHNVVLRGNTLSLIDLESVLPLSWYGKDIAFSKQMLQQVDVGYPVQNKFHSPSWYANYIEKLIVLQDDPEEKHR